MATVMQKSHAKRFHNLTITTFKYEFFYLNLAIKSFLLFYFVNADFCIFYQFLHSISENLIQYKCTKCFIAGSFSLTVLTMNY